MRRYTAALLFTIISPAALAQIHVGLKAETGYWQTGVDGDAVGMLTGANIAYQYSQFFTGINYLTGNYTIDSQSVDINRTDSDFSIGYIISPTYNVFLGYKQTDIDYINSEKSIQYQELIDTVGVGGSITQPINEKWTLVGTGSIHVPKTRYQEINFITKSEGYGQSLLANLAYQLGKNTSASTSFRFQSFTVEYEDGLSLTTQLWQLGVNLGYRF